MRNAGNPTQWKPFLKWSIHYVDGWFGAWIEWWIAIIFCQLILFWWIKSVTEHWSYFLLCGVTQLLNRPVETFSKIILLASSGFYLPRHFVTLTSDCLCLSGTSDDRLVQKMVTTKTKCTESQWSVFSRTTRPKWIRVIGLFAEDASVTPASLHFVRQSG